MEAWKRGWSGAEKKVVIGDGAEWIRNLAAGHLPGAVQIVDLYHAGQHLWDIARSLYPHQDSNQRAWMKIHQKRLLDKGKIEKLVVALRSIDSDNPEIPDKLRTGANYFETNANRMRDPQFRRQHLFVGSVIESSAIMSRGQSSSFAYQPVSPSCIVETRWSLQCRMVPCLRLEKSLGIPHPQRE